MPVVGLVTDRRVFEGMPVHQANDEYITAIRGGAGALPLLIPLVIILMRQLSKGEVQI